MVRNGYLDYSKCILRNRGAILTDIRNRIRDLDREAPAELCKVYRTPECLREWSLEMNDVLIEDGQFLTDIVLIKAVRSINIANTYQFRGGIIRQSMTMVAAGRFERREEGLECRDGDDLSSYLRTIDRQLQNEFNESSRFRGADTYDHKRMIPKKGMRTDKGQKRSGRWHFEEAIGIIKGW